MRKDLLYSVAKIAEVQGYKAAKEVIVKWNDDADVDKYWAMRIAHIAASDNLGVQAAYHAVEHPEQWDGRTESERMADMILGYNAHFDPEYKGYIGQDPDIVYMNGGGCYRKSEVNTDLSEFAKMVNDDTKAILKHPDMQQGDAMRFERFMRE